MKLRVNKSEPINRTRLAEMRNPIPTIESEEVVRFRVEVAFGLEDLKIEECCIIAGLRSAHLCTFLHNAQLISESKVRSPDPLPDEVVEHSTDESSDTHEREIESTLSTALLAKLRGMRKKTQGTKKAMQRQRLRDSRIIAVTTGDRWFFKRSDGEMLNGEWLFGKQDLVRIRRDQYAEQMTLGFHIEANAVDLEITSDSEVRNEVASVIKMIILDGTPSTASGSRILSDFATSVKT